MIRTASLLIAGVLALGAALPAAAQDAPPPDPGRRVYNQCRACHVIDNNGRNGVGPNLHGIVGRKAASIEGFNYSPAMKAKGGEGWVWTEDHLFNYLENPRAMVPGTSMSYPGLKDEQQRRDLIEFLKKQG